MREAFAHFFSTKKYWHISVTTVWNFKKMLTNNIVNFEQTPDLDLISKVTGGLKIGNFYQNHDISCRTRWVSTIHCMHISLVNLKSWLVTLTLFSRSKDDSIFIVPKNKIRYESWTVLCLTQIEAFNTEEEAFGWQTTAYPQRQTIINTLKPYLQLYDTTVEFNNKYK